MHGQVDVHQVQVVDMFLGNCNWYQYQFDSISGIHYLAVASELLFSLDTRYVLIWYYGWRQCKIILPNMLFSWGRFISSDCLLFIMWGGGYLYLSVVYYAGGICVIYNPKQIEWDGGGSGSRSYYFCFCVDKKTCRTCLIICIMVATCVIMHYYSMWNTMCWAFF